MGHNPTSIAYFYYQRMVFVANTGSDSVTVIDANTNTVKRTIYVPSPRAITADAWNGTVWVAGGNGMLYDLDPYQGVIRASFGQPSSITHHDMAPMPHSHRLYTTLAGYPGVSEWDVRRGQYVNFGQYAVDESHSSLAVNQAETRVYVAGNGYPSNPYGGLLRVFNATARQWITPVSVPRSSSVAVDPREHQVYVGSATHRMFFFDPATHQTTGSIEMAGVPRDIAVAWIHT